MRRVSKESTLQTLCTTAEDDTGAFTPNSESLAGVRHDIGGPIPARQLMKVLLLGSGDCLEVSVLETLLYLRHLDDTTCLVLYGILAV